MNDDRRERLDHLRGALQLLGAGIEAGTDIVEDMHRTIAAGPLAALDAVSKRQISRVHDSVRRGVYAWIRGASRLVFRVADVALAHAGPALAPPAIPGPLVGVLHGILGDGMDRDDNPMRIAMHLRHEGRRVPVTVDGLADVLPEKYERLVVFVHGLACDESSWGHASVKAWGRPDVSYASLLRAQGLGTVHVRYNSGLRIDANGRALSALLGELLATRPVTDLILIGHSMGGLVVRSACHHGRGQAWTTHVRDVVCIGSPHGGAPLEKAGVLATALLRAIPVTAAIGRAADRRSAGIKDLGAGTIVADRPTDDPLSHARYHFIAGSYGSTARTRALGWAFGDGLVRVASARHDHDQRGPHPRVTRVHLAGLHHMHLLNHPRVFAHLEATLLRSLV